MSLMQSMMSSRALHLLLEASVSSSAALTALDSSGKLCWTLLSSTTAATSSGTSAPPSAHSFVYNPAVLQACGITYPAVGLATTGSAVVITEGSRSAQAALSQAVAGIYRRLAISYPKQLCLQPTAPSFPPLTQISCVAALLLHPHPEARNATVESLKEVLLHSSERHKVGLLAVIL